MGFNEINHKINMKVKKDYQVIISPLLQSMLGFRQAIFPEAGGGGEYVSDWVADLMKGLNCLYVYCPLVEPRMVGDAQVPLLWIIPVEGRDGEMITLVFDSVQYCPLLQRRFQTVEIDIRDNTGSIVSFERGRVVVTLHCRKRKEFSLEWNQLIVTIRKLTTIITYTKQENDIRYLREDDIKEDMDLAISLEDSLKQPCLCWKREQRP